jgi:hypothetical protein
VEVIAIPRSTAWRLRSALSLALAAAILAMALPAAFGGGVWGGGMDPAQLLSASPSPPASTQPAEHLHPQRPLRRP